MVQPEALKNLLRKMVDIYSPSGKENDILDFLKSYLRSREMDIITQPVDDVRYNLIAAPADDIRLALIGHVDTTSAYDLDDYGYAEEDGIIYGLGAADMKGGCAAMVEAFLAFQKQNHFQAPVALCLLVGEEENGDGAAELIKSYHFPWAVVGEPTDLVPCLSCHGYLEIQTACKGKRIHASLASTRQTAIDALLHMMLRLSEYLRNSRPELVFNFRDLYSIPSGFAAPGQCEAWLDIHAPPDAAVGDIVTELEEVGLKAPENGAEIELCFQIETIDAGYRLPEKGTTVNAIKAAFSDLSLPWQTGDFRSHSDANQLWTAGIKPVVLGPGQLECAHVPEESVAFKDILTASRIYLNLMKRLFP